MAHPPLNGTVLAWEDTGRGPAVVLVHGIFETRESWRHQVPVLARPFRVLACDVRGFGASQTGAGAGTAAQFADDTAALLRYLGIEGAVVVGFSMGGVIAQRFAIDHPDLARGVVIAASSSVVGRRAASHFRERAALAEREGLPALLALVDEDARGCFAVSGPERVAEYAALRRAAVRDPRGYANACRAMAGLHERPLGADLGRVRCPALVVTGAADVACPPKAAEMIQRELPRARLEIVPRVGHCLHWEDTEGFNALVLEFLDGLATGNRGWSSG